MYFICLAGWDNWNELSLGERVVLLSRRDESRRTRAYTLAGWLSTVTVQGETDSDRTFRECASVVIRDSERLCEMRSDSLHTEDASRLCMRLWRNMWRLIEVTDDEDVKRDLKDSIEKLFVAGADFRGQTHTVESETQEEKDVTASEADDPVQPPKAPHPRDSSSSSEGSETLGVETLFIGSEEEQVFVVSEQDAFEEFEANRKLVEADLKEQEEREAREKLLLGQVHKELDKGEKKRNGRRKKQDRRQRRGRKAKEAAEAKYGAAWEYACNLCRSKAELTGGKLHLCALDKAYMKYSQPTPEESAALEESWAVTAMEATEPKGGDEFLTGEELFYLQQKWVEEERKKQERKDAEALEEFRRQGVLCAKAYTLEDVGLIGPVGAPYWPTPQEMEEGKKCGRAYGRGVWPDHTEILYDVFMAWAKGKGENALRNYLNLTVALTEAEKEELDCTAMGLYLETSGSDWSEGEEGSEVKVSSSGVTAQKEEVTSASGAADSDSDSSVVTAIFVGREDPTDIACLQDLSAPSDEEDYVPIATVIARKKGSPDQA